VMKSALAIATWDDNIKTDPKKKQVVCEVRSGMN
jgi:hypothetical protein